MNAGKRKTTKKLAASHQRSWLWGRHAVLEMLKARRWPAVELFADSAIDFSEIAEIQTVIDANGPEIQFVDDSRLTQLCQSYDHQGLVARMAEFPCEDSIALIDAVNEALVNSTQQSNSLQPLFAMCDRIQDAHNFGAILRCCDAMKLNGIIIGDRYQSAITPHVARSSAGAVNHQRIFRVPVLTESVTTLRQAGLQIIAASEKAEMTLWKAKLNQPAVIIIGSETAGVAPELRALCDLQVSIPMLGGVNSLNAAVASGIVLYECRRQQLSR